MLYAKKMRYIIFTFILLPYLSFGQDNLPEDLILTKGDNDIWIDSLQDLNDEEILQALSKRILLDTNIYLHQSYPDRLRDKSEIEIDSLKIIGECKPFILINKQVFDTSNDVSNDVIEKLAHVIRTGKFKNIRIFNHQDRNAFALYGMKADCGIFIMNTSNRKTRKRVEEINFK